MQLKDVNTFTVFLLLAVCLALLGSCAQPGDDGAPGQAAAGFIVSGGPILTLGEPAAVEAIAVGDGVILALGDRDSVEGLRGPDTVDLDLAGRVLVPAFVDHHVHLLNLGFALLNRAERGERPSSTSPGGRSRRSADAVRTRADDAAAGDLGPRPGLEPGRLGPRRCRPTRR